MKKKWMNSMAAAVMAASLIVGLTGIGAAAADDSAAADG